MINIIKTLALAVFIIGTSCSKNKNGKAEEPETQKETLRVMTYNIHIGNPPSEAATVVNLEATAKAIKLGNPDLVALQEVDKFTTRSGVNLDQAKKLAELTGMNYYFAKAIDRSNGEYGVAILSKFPIKTSSRYSLPVVSGSGAELRVVGIIQVELPNGKRIYFVSTHFDHLAESNRELHARELLKAIQPYKESPVIVGGDFNMPPSSDTWNIIKTEMTMGCNTCPSTFPATNPTTTIDYILLNKKASSYFSVKSYQTITERYASDHVPIIAELQY
ncbi:endonuclease/exonuclease/phosphatase family protein [Pedobacter nyackensis]|uniref:Metal-dependent hydrolase, endonuclease/exonuclease/phosphatase family n=1 Tax=Pedobacter nyackensis TaxID=475255 RepID=A0A1W2CLT4_9SPHI|nr:endonuclease/exonuclease/phosphatase family protein [Pedobacter nyackensis]SMC86151.1 Metal-dependent hydrolase, endonuclease/exonuclease/phosphatase family [Pedobacter nyackensis]